MDLTQTVELYDPHSGRAFDGAAAPLPKPVKDLADKLAGQKLTLEKALEEIKPAAEKVGGMAEIAERYNCIFFSYHDRSGAMHLYRLLRYKVI